MFSFSGKTQMRTRLARIRTDRIYAEPVTDSSASALARSIRLCGMLRPVVVRPKGREYEVVAGHRRFSGAVLAGLRYVDALVCADEQTCLACALAERLSEKPDLFEEARALRDAAAAGLSYKRISGVTGIPVQGVTDRIRLLQLDKGMREQIAEAKLTCEQALEILNLPPESRRERLSELSPFPLRAKISGFVRDGAIVARPVFQTLDRMEKAGIRFDFGQSEDSERLKLNIVLYKRM